MTYFFHSTLVVSDVVFQLAALTSVRVQAMLLKTSDLNDYSDVIGFRNIFLALRAEFPKFVPQALVSFEILGNPQAIP